MMDTVLAQIFLKSTSSMSLDERFTMMLKNQRTPQTGIRDTVPQQVTTSSVKNQRLAQQMASRPAVVAALQNNLSVTQPQFKSIKARLGRPMVRGSLHGMSQSRRKPRGSDVLLRGALSPTLTNWYLNEQQHGPLISRRGLTQRGLRRALRGKAGRGMLSVDRGSAGRSVRPNSRPLPTREELDAQLDDYMSMTKSHLDAQLDAYMAEVDPVDVLQ